jgi:hypothetical protein
MGLWEFLDLNENRLKEYERKSNDEKKRFKNNQTDIKPDFARQISREQDKIQVSFSLMILTTNKAYLIGSIYRIKISQTKTKLT